MHGKCIEQQKPLYQVFVDLTKAFDTVSREGLSIIFAKIGCPCVTFNGQLSGEIAIDNVVKQGNILAPALFSIFIAVLLTHSKNFR